MVPVLRIFFFFFQAEDGIRDVAVTGVQTCALPISSLGPAIRMYQPLAPPGSNVTPARTKRRGCRMKTTRARMTAHRSAKVEENAISRSSTIRLTLGRSPRSSSAQADAEQQETGARDAERD